MIYLSFKKLLNKMHKIKRFKINIKLWSINHKYKEKTINKKFSNLILMVTIK